MSSSSALPGSMTSASPAHGAQAVRTQQLLSASPFPLLLRLAAPNSLAFFVQACVSMTEVWYVDGARLSVADAHAMPRYAVACESTAPWPPRPASRAGPSSA